MEMIPTDNKDISDLINAACVAKGILKENEKITLHCFRRGGVQHRFFPQPGRKKTHTSNLDDIKYWGGWGQSEKINIGTLHH